MTVHWDDRREDALRILREAEEREGFWWFPPELNALRNRLENDRAAWVASRTA